MFLKLGQDATYLQWTVDKLWVIMDFSLYYKV